MSIRNIYKFPVEKTKFPIVLMSETSLCFDLRSLINRYLWNNFGFQRNLTWRKWRLICIMRTVAKVVMWSWWRWCIRIETCFPVFSCRSDSFFTILRVISIDISKSILRFSRNLTWNKGRPCSKTFVFTRETFCCERTLWFLV